MQFKFPKPQTYAQAANWIRGVLLFLSLLFVAMYLLWRYSPESVAYIDNSIVKSHVREFDERLKVSVALLKTDQDKALAGLEAILDDLKDSRKSDRLGKIKGRTFQLVVDELIGREEAAEALMWLDQWIEFDDHNLVSLSTRANLLFSLPSRKDEGMEALGRLYKMTPENGVLAMQYSNALFSEGRIDDAFIVFSDYHGYKGAQDPSWIPEVRVFWNYGEGFSEKTAGDPKVYQFDTKAYGFYLNATHKPIQFRVDPEARAGIRLSNIRLLLWNRARSECFLLDEEQLILNDLRWVERDELVSVGVDPYFAWDVPLDWREPDVSGFLLVDMDQYGDWLVTVAGSSVRSRASALARKGHLGSMGDGPYVPSSDGAVDSNMNECVGNGLLERMERQSFSLFWNDRGDSKVGQKYDLNPKWNGNRFRVDFPVNDSVPEITIELPKSSIVKYRLQSIILDSVDGSSVLAPMPTGIELHDVHVEDKWMLVTGEDPSVVIPLSDFGSDVVGIAVEGQLP